MALEGQGFRYKKKCAGVRWDGAWGGEVSGWVGGGGKGGGGHMRSATRLADVHVPQTIRKWLPRLQHPPYTDSVPTDAPGPGHTDTQHQMC